MHQHLNRQDRACIADLLRKRYTYSEIARILEVHPSTISREVSRIKYNKKKAKKFLT